MSTPTPAPATKNLSWEVVFGGVVAVVLLAAGIWWVVSSVSGGDEPSSSDLRVLAESACEGAVEQSLKAPSTAKFDSDVSGSGPWTVTGSVDAENSFGAMIRSSYSCTVELDGDRMVATLNQLG